MAYHFEQIKILLVEDNKAMLNLVKSVLQSFGVGTIATALDGEEAFKIYCDLNPDLVIADWMMTPCDGITLSRKIRNDPKSPNQFVPIILMTGFSEKHRVINARDAGISEFLVKPFNARDLYKRIYQIIEKPRQFIRSEEFFGPDRRRKGVEEYHGPMRRKTDEDKGDDKSDIPVTSIDFL